VDPALSAMVSSFDGASGITVGEIQSTAGEEVRFLEVLAVAIHFGAVLDGWGLDRHDRGVDAFGDTVGDASRVVRYGVVQSLLECAREFPHRLESCVDPTPVPVLKNE
jgi:hypothetical protein